MGQKTHPIGLRLGLHRKWASSWFITSTSTSRINNKISPYLIARGGNVQSGIEAFIINARIRRSAPFALKSKTSEKSQDHSGSFESPLQTRISTVHRFFPVNIQIRKGSAGALYIVFFYIKLFGRDNTQLWLFKNRHLQQSIVLQFQKILIFIQIMKRQIVPLLILVEQ